MIKKALREQKYNQIGRFPKFFLAKEKQRVGNLDLMAWPGYELNSRLASQGYFINIDSCTKFVNTTSIFDIVNEERKYGKSDE